MLRNSTEAGAPNRALLAHVGETIYGPQWQEPLAQALGVSSRSMRYWLAGRTIPPGIWPDLRAIAQSRGAEIAALIEEL